MNITLKVEDDKQTDSNIVAIFNGSRYGDIIYVTVKDNIIYINKEDIDKLKDVTYYAIYPPKGEFDILDSGRYKTKNKEFKIETI